MGIERSLRVLGVGVGIFLMFAVSAVSQQQLTSDGLKAALIAAGTEEEQSALVAANPALITPDLNKAVQAEGRRMFQAGNFEGARVSWAATLAITAKLGDTRLTANALNNLGTVYAAQSSYAKALEYFQKAYALYEQTNRPEDLLDTLSNIASVYRWLLDFDQALSAHHRVLAMAEAMNDKRRIAIPCINIGIILMEKEQNTAALEYLQRGVALMKELKDGRNTAMGLVSIGNVLRAVGRPAEAIASFSEALSIQDAQHDRAGMAYGLGSIAYLELLRGRAADAIAPAERGLALAQEAGVRESIWRIASTLGYSYMALEKYAAARTAFQQGITTVEEMRQDLVGDEREQQRFFSDKLDPYWGMMELAQKQGNGLLALDYAELAKARMLLDVARSGRSRVIQAMTADEQEREQQLGRALAAATLQLRREMAASPARPARLTELRQTRNHARLEYEEFHTRLYAVHPQLKIKRGEAEWAGLQGMALLLPKSAAAIEFTVTHDKVYGFVIAHDRLGETSLRTWIADVSPAELMKRTQELRRRMQQRDLGFRLQAAALYQTLLAPAAPELAGKDTVIIVPDRVLWEMPFQALWNRGRYFLEDYAVLYAPSLAVLEAMGGAAAPTQVAKGILAVGAPALGQTSSTGRERGSPAPLADAAREVQMLGTLYGRASSTVLTGANATESRVKSEAGHYSILHFATHGIRDQGTPMSSYIVLSQPLKGEGEDGLLEAREVMQLNLHANLVVLSACETALGAVGSGEGMIGLTWALFIAGAPTVVASHWRVESRATTDLMIAMHRELATGGPSLQSSIGISRALRTSALRLLRTPAFAHPFYWAGFVTIGGRM